MPYKQVLKYETFIIVGVIMTISAFLNATGLIAISSDYFWMLAGLGLIIEGSLELKRYNEDKKNVKIKIRTKK